MFGLRFAGIEHTYSQDPRRPLGVIEPGLDWKGAMWRVLFALAVFLPGCASSSKTFGPDGREIHVLNCSDWARSWSMCLERAGELCGANGYDVLDRSGETSGYLISGSSASPLISREMAIACKAPR